MNRILIIEDDVTLASGLSSYFRAEGFDVHLVHQLKEAAMLKMDFSLIILDWMLPDGQGIDFLKSLREQNQHIPVLFLTAKSDLVDKVVGLESGANDYLTKPFELRELLARVRVLLRKQVNESKIIIFQNIKLDHLTREVSVENRTVETTKKEFDLLALLMSSPAKVFSREELLNKVWGFENYPTTRTVDTHVLQLRQKISDDLIQTVRGIGYRLRTDKEFT